MAVALAATKYYFPYYMLQPLRQQNIIFPIICYSSCGNKILFSLLYPYYMLQPLRQQNIIFPIICYSSCGNKILFSLLYVIALAATKYYFPYYMLQPLRQQNIIFPILRYSSCGNNILFGGVFVSMLRIGILCLSGATCLPTDCCFSELAL